MLSPLWLLLVVALSRSSAQPFECAEGCTKRGYVPGRTTKRLLEAAALHSSLPPFTASRRRLPAEPQKVWQPHNRYFCPLYLQQLQPRLRGVHVSAGTSGTLLIADARRLPACLTAAADFPALLAGPHLCCIYAPLVQMPLWLFRQSLRD